MVYIVQGLCVTTMVNVMNCCQGTGFDQSLMHGDCGDGDAMNCFQGAEFE